jgi:parallel beta-helix repeat protein
MFIIVITNALFIENASTMSLTRENCHSNSLHDPIDISQNYEFDILGFGGSGSMNDPYILENLEIEYNNNGKYGIRIQRTSVNFIIRNCTVIGFNYGIFLNNIEDGGIILEDNEISGSHYQGIDVNTLLNVEIAGNLLDNNGGGIRLSSSKSRITDNVIQRTSNSAAITLYSCRYLLVEGNEIKENEYVGITSGTELEDCIFKENIIESNGEGGKYPDETHLSEPYGIRLGKESCNNTIYLNFFINNNQENEKQACDEGENNTWYEETLKEGNYWDDLPIGHYEVDGNVGSKDIYPLNKDGESLNKNFYKTPIGIIGISMASAIIVGIPAVIVIRIAIRKRKARMIIYSLRYE